MNKTLVFVLRSMNPPNQIPHKIIHLHIHAHFLTHHHCCSHHRHHHHLLLVRHHHHHHHHPHHHPFNPFPPSNLPPQFPNVQQQEQQQQQEEVAPASATGLEREDMGENLELEEADGDDVFVMTDEWKEFFAKSESKRRLKKQQMKKANK